MITLYTIHCPACNILEKKLNAAQIDFEKITDEEIFAKKGIIQFPVLEIEGQLYSYGNAIKWLKEKSNGN